MIKLDRKFGPGLFSPIVLGADFDFPMQPSSSKKTLTVEIKRIMEDSKGGRNLWVKNVHFFFLLNGCILD